MKCLAFESHAGTSKTYKQKMKKKKEGKGKNTR